MVRIPANTAFSRGPGPAHPLGNACVPACRLPVMRHVLTWIGCQRATSKDAMRSIKEGRSVGLCPGGVAEIFDTNNQNEVLFLKWVAEAATAVVCRDCPHSWTHACAGAHPVF